MLRVCMFAFALLFCQILSAQVVIDPTGGITNTNISPFGEPSSATYGQTFTVPVGPNTQLDSFFFLLIDNVNPDFVDFRAYVYSWNGTRATGPQLFRSDVISTTNNAGANGPEQININTGGIQLNAGEQYVAFFSASEEFDTIRGTSQVPANNSNLYADGGFVFLVTVMIQANGLQQTGIYYFTPAMIWCPSSYLLHLFLNHLPT